ncbi:hypothetical protein FRB91_000035 [Serendipita sp. 411]|nr:hypothetical protein FRB91_000035 [Serendipita sp. 411]
MPPSITITDLASPEEPHQGKRIVRILMHIWHLLTAVLILVTVILGLILGPIRFISSHLLSTTSSTPSVDYSTSAETDSFSAVKNLASSLTSGSEPFCTWSLRQSRTTPGAYKRFLRSSFSFLDWSCSSSAVSPKKLGSLIGFRT